jgi:hypothetical protein
MGCLLLLRARYGISYLVSGECFWGVSSLRDSLVRLGFSVLFPYIFFGAGGVMACDVFFLSFLIFRAFLSLFMVYVILAFRYSELYLFCDDGCIFMCHGV